MRKPGLHIDNVNLNKLIDEFFDKHKIGTPSELLVDYLLKEGKKYALRHRSLLVNGKTQARADNIRSTPKLVGYRFAKYLHLIRVRAHHRGQTLITEFDGPQWNFVLIASALALQFCKDFSIGWEAGFPTYIKVGLDLMKPFGLNKFKTYDQKIRENYEALEVINKDPNMVYTELIYEAYEQKIFEKTGQRLDYKTRPSEYRYFVEAAAVTEELGIFWEHYLKAQFEGLDWTHGYPTPNQLATFKAKERALKWVTENNIRFKKKEAQTTDAQKEWLRKYGQ